MCILPPKNGHLSKQMEKMKKTLFLLLLGFLVIPSVLWALPNSRSEQNVLPFVDNTYDLGSTTPQNAWKDIYAIGTTSSGVFNASSTTATSTGSNGWNLTGGCFAINGTCVGGALMSSISQ